MKYLLPTLISIPTVFACGLVVYNQATGTYPLAFISTSLQTVIILLPLLAFATSVAMVFIKENAIEWRIAAVFNGIPFGLVLLVSIFFALIGYHG